MAWFDVFTVNKETAKQNNYKLDLFETISKNTEVADMSAIKKYFDKVYENENNIGFFNQRLDFEGLYTAEPTNKFNRLRDYRSMAAFPEIASALDTICYAADSPDELNQLVTLRVKSDTLEAQEIAEIKAAAQEYFDLFDFDNNFVEYFRKLLVDRSALLGKCSC